MLKVIISGGGTGGHIFPAIAIANSLKELSRDIDILFVGAEGRMEMEKVPAAGYKIEGLKISGLQRSLSLSNLTFPFKVFGSIMKANKILKRFQPDVVVGVGGYASGPILFVATLNGVPTLIQEQNSYAGITNKILGKRVNKICVAYNNMERFFPKEKIMLTGNPVRQDIQNLQGKRERGLEYFGLSGDKKILLVIGGSLGAKTINESIKTGLKKFVANDIQVVWQTGKSYFASAKAAAESYQDSGIKVYDFITKMDYAYAVADAVVSRAGASSVSELCLVKKPAILVPSPNVAEDHQTMNAMALVNYNAAVLVKDNEAGEKLCDEAISLMKDEVRRIKLQENIARLAFQDSGIAIANEILRLVKKK